ncbi:MAG: hypothetical protein CMO55_12810 [Verrucomicrobiales bacterium]|nr:hypothetical protein [Verrucomicrobiales bacterium]
MSIKKRTVVMLAVSTVSVAAFALQLRTPTGQFDPVDYNPDLAEFRGTVKAEWIRNSDPRDAKKFKLLDTIEYTASNGTTWTANSGSEIDGASIPRIFWTLVGAPTTGLYRDASVIHDVYCDSRERSWEETHWVFRDACREAGLGPWKANLMYLAVFHYGPIWDLEGNLQRAVQPVSPETAKKMRDFCRDNPDLTAEQLRQIDPRIWEI